MRILITFGLLLLNFQIFSQGLNCHDILQGTRCSDIADKSVQAYQLCCAGPQEMENPDHDESDTK